MFSDYTNNGMIDICFKVEIEDTYTKKDMDVSFLLSNNDDFRYSKSLKETHINQYGGKPL